MNATNGPLGGRIKYPIITWWNFITPGTITSPLIPKVKAIRSVWLVLAYVLYLGLIIRALRQD